MRTIMINTDVVVDVAGLLLLHRPTQYSRQLRAQFTEITINISTINDIVVDKSSITEITVNISTINNITANNSTLNEIAQLVKLPSITANSKLLKYH